MPVVPQLSTMAFAIFNTARSAADAEALAITAGSVGYPAAAGTWSELSKKPVRWTFRDGSALVIDNTGAMFI